MKAAPANQAFLEGNSKTQATSCLAYVGGCRQDGEHCAARRWAKCNGAAHDAIAASCAAGTLCKQEESVRISDRISATGSRAHNRGRSTLLLWLLCQSQMVRFLTRARDWRLTSIDPDILQRVI